MAEYHPVELTKVLEFVKDYLTVIQTNVIEISHKRNTLKSRVKQLSLIYKIPKDFANYISLFLMATKIIYVENKIWHVDHVMAEKLDRPGFLARNLFKFLHFSKDYNEYYKSPLVFNTIFANNDFEVINKRKSILRTLHDLTHEAPISFDHFYQILNKRYAFFRDYNNPSNFYYTKGDVYSNKQFIFIFLFKTLFFLGVLHLERKGKLMSDYYFSITSTGIMLIEDWVSKEGLHRRPSVNLEKIKLLPYSVIRKDAYHLESLNLMFNGFVPKVKRHDDTSSSNDILAGLRHRIIRKVQDENIPNLLV